ncbi:MAG: DUF3147 family protein [Candidatus Acidiferrales bacterium]
MIEETLLRILIGGLVVSAFAVLGDLFKPKSFAGLFGAAPSVALATLVLTISKNGKVYAAKEAHSMMAGAIAFCVYASCASWLMMRRKLPALAVTSALVAVWLAAAFGLWFIWLR